MNHPHEIKISPTKLEKADGYAGFIGNIAELVATGVTTFSLLPSLFRHVSDFAVKYDVFVISARALVSIGMLFTAYQYFQYTLFFGAGALAFIGQFLIGAFFVAVVFLTRDGLPIMTAALGMYLLVNSF